MDGVTFFLSSYALFSLIGEGNLRGWGGFLQSLHGVFSLIKERFLSGWSDLLSPRMPCSP